jgi:hypothetical protein
MYIPVTIAQTDTMPMKRTLLKIAGQCKKMKVHKGVPEFTITENGIELVAEKVQYCIVEALYDVEK